LSVSDEAKKTWEWFLNTVRGRRDIKSRVAVLASPENYKTMSILTKSEAEFVTDAFWLAKNEECYNPLRDYAQEKMETSPSVGGQGREQTIRLMGALSESRILTKLGITTKGEEKEK